MVFHPMFARDLLSQYRQLSQGLFTVVDVETTGIYPPQSRVIEISVLQATLAEGILHQHTSLVNPGVPIPAEITRFTGITPTMVQAASPPEIVLPPYFAQLQHGTLTAHNLEFDYGFLQAEFHRLDQVLERSEEECLCTVQLARLMLPKLRSRSLPNLVKHFQLDVGTSHRAEADTQACWLLAQRLLTELLQEPDNVLLKRFAQQWLPLKQAARMMGCQPAVGRSRLEAAGIKGRLVGKGRSQTWMFQRGDVERVILDQPSP
jgi:DNA polymerase-3 subunit epsilon